MEKKLKDFYKNRKVLVTGATGFKGAWLCQWLVLLGAKVSGIGFSPNKNKNLFYSLRLQNKINLKLLDIRNKKKLYTFLKSSKPEIIFHLAAQPLIFEGYKKPYETYDINFNGTLNLLENARTLDFIKSFICITSDKCYADNFSTKGFTENDKLGGVDPYSGSKASIEILAKSYYESFFKFKKRSIATGRAGNVIGGGDWSPNRLIPDIVNSIHKNKTVVIRNPKFNRPWQHVLEPLYGYLILGRMSLIKPLKFSGAWNFGPKKDKVVDVMSIVKNLIKYWNKGKYKAKQNKKYYEQTNLQLDINKAKKILKWKPKYNTAKSLKITFEWYKNVLEDKYTPQEITTNQIINYMNDK